MYKKIMVFFGLLCSLTQHASDLRSWLEIKPGYFFFSAQPMHQIYDHGGFQVQASASIPVYDHLDFYGSVGFREAWGHALDSGQSTKIMVIPVDIGLKPVFNFGKRCSYFFAVGPRYFCFDQENNSSYVDSIINSAGIGCFVNTGLNVQLADNFLLGFFGEYSYENKIIDSNTPNVYSGGNIQLGGFVFGMSFGYEL